VTFHFDENKFLLNQKVFTIGSKYDVLDESGHPLCYLKQKIWTLKRHVDVYASETSENVLMRIVQDRIFTLFTSFSVIDEAGQLVGRICQKFSLFRRTYGVKSFAGEEIATAEQDVVSSVLGATSRGYVRDLANFNIMMKGEQIGVFNRKLMLFDRYVMDIYDDPVKRLDRRLALALAVILDLGEDR